MSGGSPEWPGECEPNPSRAEPLPVSRASLESRRVLVVGIVLECFLGVVALAIAWPLGLPLLERLYSSASAVSLPMLLLQGIAATLPPVAVYLLLLPLRWTPLERVRRLVRFFVSIRLRGRSVFELTLLCAAAGWGEELLFRGLIQGGTALLLAPAVPCAPWIAVTVAAVLFALAHAVSKTYVLLAFVIGFYFGAVVVWTGSLLPAVIAHGLYDLFVIVRVRSN